MSTQDPPRSEDEGFFASQLSSINPLGPDRTVEQMLVRELRALIIAGKLAPGAHLPYRDLARQFSVSVTPVRIALLELAKEGIVEARPHGGVRVAAVSLEELEEIYAMRVGFESWLARLGAARLEDSDLAAMETHLKDAKRSVKAGDRHGFLNSAWAYRMAAYQAAGRDRLLEQVTLLFHRTARYNELALSPEDRFEDSLSYTKEFRNACVDRDGPRAQAAIRALLDRSLEHLVRQLPDLAARSDD